MPALLRQLAGDLQRVVMLPDAKQQISAGQRESDPRRPGAATLEAPNHGNQQENVKSWRCWIASEVHLGNVGLTE